MGIYNILNESLEKLELGVYPYTFDKSLEEYTYRSVAFMLNNNDMQCEGGKSIPLGSILHTKNLPKDKWHELPCEHYTLWVIFCAGKEPIFRDILEYDKQFHTITCHAFNELIPDAIIDLQEVESLYFVTDIAYNAVRRYCRYKPVIISEIEKGASF